MHYPFAKEMKMMRTLDEIIGFIEVPITSKCTAHAYATRVSHRSIKWRLPISTCVSCFASFHFFFVLKLCFYRIFFISLH